MSVLLTGLDDELAAAVAERLIAQEDEVRIILTGGASSETWRARGVYVATGDLSDEDFVWRACGGVRTVVVEPSVVAGEEGAIFVAGARRAGVDRFVVVGEAPPGDNVLDTGDVDRIILRLPKKGLLRRNPVTASDLAAAVDAADDLAGSPRLDLDLSVPDSWAQLRLEAPRAL